MWRPRRSKRGFVRDVLLIRYLRKITNNRYNNFTKLNLQIKKSTKFKTEFGVDSSVCTLYRESLYSDYKFCKRKVHKPNTHKIHLYRMIYTKLHMEQYHKSRIVSQSFVTNQDRIRRLIHRLPNLWINISTILPPQFSPRGVLLKGALNWSPIIPRVRGLSGSVSIFTLAAQTEKYFSVLRESNMMDLTTFHSKWSKLNSIWF